MTNHMVKDKAGRWPEGKFDVSTPNFGSHDYCWILHPKTGGVPLSKRIIRDVNKFFESIVMVRKSEGINIDSLGNRKVKRQEATC